MTSPTAEWYLRFADTEARGVYAEWARGLAADPEVVGRLDELPEQRRQPSLVFAVARLLGAEAGSWPSLREWLLANWAALAREVPRRSTQTNEPRRCAPVLAALALVPGPIALIEVGASAGLTLLLDRYSYRFGDARVGDSTLTLHCDVSGEAPIPRSLPDVRWRCGIDLAPLDVRDAEDVRWLEALVPPGQPDRLDRLRRAIDIARLDPPQIVAGDAVDALAAVVHRVPAGLTPVVTSIGTLVYVPGARRAKFRQLVRDLGCRWVAMERVGVFPDLVPPNLPSSAHPAASLITLDERPLALAAPHGEHLAWLPG